MTEVVSDTLYSTDRVSNANGSSAGLVCLGLSKSYGGTSVLTQVDLSLTPGSVLGLVGENGAGKSTTSSIIAGMVRPDGGSMTIDGEIYDPQSPADALKAGVALIHQEIRMVSELSVAENIFLGRLPMRRGRVDRKLMNEESRSILKLLGSDTDPRRQVAGLSIAAQQEIEIARALTREPRYIIFDEPSASLGESETERVFDQIRILRDQGAGIVYISHRLEEIRTLADTVVCLRDGKRVAAWETGDVSKEDIVRAMVGRDFVFSHLAPKDATTEVALEVRGLGRTGIFEGINFAVNRGEILGFSGLVGAGRTEMVRTIAGADRHDAGEILVDGTAVKIRGPRSAINAGIAMVPEDRKGQGLNLDRTGAENITLPWEPSLTTGGIMTVRTVNATANLQREFLDIRSKLDIPVGSLSGGNQQKVLLGKWLVTRPRVLILDEPTRGVDVGAKMAIYKTIRSLAEQGVAIIVISSELEEVLGLSHRVLVMSGGRQRGILDRADATPEAVMALALITDSSDDAQPSNQPGSSPQGRSESQ
ncbi:sugar ABC transporter ATP-binding protein [Cryobacterium sp. Hh11]|uniref:sugar ABC transporter ATP-binding protein n=1 Tax=Cryobacterium sp. Hh11 TaxID=2555868 RepID=UPI001F542474|nr:sugar ABC transporter ATP-binding protein [Cryobacterium sp. Hh11]